MPERLEKLRIKNVDTPGVEFSVLFNPTEYSVEDASKWAEQERVGEKPELHYTGGDRKKLSMELFFDTYEDGTDVRAHSSLVADLLVVNAEKHRPPKLELTWGDAEAGVHAIFPFVCVLESVKQQFVLFLGDGTPVRAKLTVVFLEFSLPEEEQQKNPKNSPDHTKTYTVKTGDTLSGIAALFYDNPGDWRAIARANDVEDPRRLPAGLLLAIPRLD